MSQTVIAVNHAERSANPIHADDGAQRLGLRAGLVGGVTLLGYLTRAATQRWGVDWTAHGSISARFRAPVYHGDELRIEVSGQNSGLGVALINTDGIASATAEVTPPQTDSGHHGDGGDPARCDPETIQAWHPDELPLIGYQTLQACPGLHPYRFTAGADGLTPLPGPEEDPGPLSEIAAVETLAVASIDIMYSTFRATGPRILTGLNTRQFRSARHGEVLTARGRIAQVWRHRDRTYARNDVLIRTEAGKPVLRMQNTTIWELP